MGFKSSFIGKRIRSFGHAFSGLFQMVKDEPNARIHVIAAITVIALGCYLGIDSISWMWISLSIALVFSAELFNTAIENLANVVSPDYNEFIKKAKDMSAAAVLICAIFSLVVAAIVFTPFLA